MPLQISWVDSLFGVVHEDGEWPWLSLGVIVQPRSRNTVLIYDGVSSGWQSNN